MPGSIGEINARLTLDTASFDGKMKASSELTSASSRAMAKAAKQSADAQAFAARFAAETISDQSLKIVAARRMEQAAYGELRKAQAVAKSGYLDEAQGANVEAAALQRLTAAKLASAAASERESKAGSHGVTDRMAASSVVRGLETGNVGIRSVENFLTTVPGASKVLQGLFSVIGPVAFAAAVFEGGEKIYEMGKKAAQARDSIVSMFADGHDKARVTIDDLTITSDKLQDQIDKISGHPNNGLRTALDEARKMADQLLVSLQADRKELEALFKENSVGTFGSLLSGVASTGKQETEILKDYKGITESVRQANVDYTVAVSKDGSPAAIKAAQDKRNAAVRASFQSQIDAYKTEAARLRQEQTDSARQAEDAAKSMAMHQGGGYIPRVIDNGGKIANIEGSAQKLQERMDMETAQQRIGGQEAQLGSLKQAKDSVEAGRKIDEMRLKAMEASLAQEKLLHSMSVKETYDFWNAQRQAFAVGSAAYNTIVEKQAALAVESATKAHEAIKRFQDEQKKLAGESSAGLILRGNSDMQRGAVKDANAVSQGYIDNNLEAIATAKNAAREEEARITDEAGRSISRYAAATQIAAAHTRAWAVEQSSLQAILNTRNAQLAIDPKNDTLIAAQSKAQIDVAKASTSRSIEVRGDSDAIYGRQTSAIVGATDALTEFAKSTQDASSTAREFAQGVIQGTNSEIIKSLTTRDYSKRREFGNLGAGFARDAAGIGLNKLEGSALSALGSGSGKKPTGTAGDPIHVVMAALAAGGLNAGTAVANAMSGKSEDGPIGTIGSVLTAMIPGFASGVTNFTGGMAMVGENGPELAYLPSGSGVVPNNRLNSFGGDSHIHNWAIDARGATDPAQVHKQIMAAAPHIVAASMAATADKARRTPPTRR